MKAAVTVVLLAAGTAALVASAACGTSLDIRPDGPAPTDDGGGDGGATTGAEGGAAGDSSADAPVNTSGKLEFQLVDPQVGVLAPDGPAIVPTMVRVSLLRPAGDTSAVTVTFAPIADLDVVGPAMPTTASDLTFSVTAKGNATPRRLPVDVTAKNATDSVTHALAVLLARHYRTGGDAQLIDITSAGTQTYAVSAWGGGGGLPRGSGGGYASDVLTLVPGKYLVVVGGGGGSAGAGGVPGGGDGYQVEGGGGGGYSGIFAQATTTPSFTNARLVAGGGGGGGSGPESAVPPAPELGGAGGSTGSFSAESGGGSGAGSGAGPSSFGAAGPSATPGLTLRGGNGAIATASFAGGGGGGGYYGGGGGGAGAGGGGGSSITTNAAGVTEGGHDILPGHFGVNEALRKTAGDPQLAGAVIVVPQ